MNSVPSPSFVSTSSVPPCPFTTISYASDSPNPVPSPVGLVVKKGWRILAFTSSGIPAPLSFILNTTWLFSFLDEIHKQYVVTAKAKGLNDKQVLYGHVFRNAMLIIIAGFPAALLGVFFTGSFLIEVIFNLDGLGLLSFESVINRDYPVIFGTLYIFTLIGLILRIISDLTYMFVDPRIDFNSRN